MRVCIVAPTEYARVGQVVREEVAQPVDTVVRRPRLLAVSVQTMDCDNTAVQLVANAQTSDRKHTQWLGWCLQLPLASRVQLQQLALQTLEMLRMSRVLQEPARMLVRMGRKAVYKKHLYLALLRAEVKKPSHRVSSG
jgi:hypothetical protein